MASEDLPANGYGGPADLPAPLTPKQRLRCELRGVRAAYVAGLASDRRAMLEAGLAAILAANLPIALTTMRKSDVAATPHITASYAARGAEIDPGPASVFPRVGGDMLTFHRCARHALIRGFAGIAEPPADAPAVEPDIVLVPLVAVDVHGNRIGQGAGHYDRTLAVLRARRAVLVVGVAWDIQLVDAPPADPWDQPLDALATPSLWHDFTAARRR